MKLIPLSKNSKNPEVKGKYFAKVDDDDYEFLMKWGWSASYSKRAKTYIATRSIRRKDTNGKIVKGTIYMHRIIMNTPDGLEVDHADHDTLNNQKRNLRNCTNSENQYNKFKRSGTSSKYIGVCKSKKANKWQSAIKGDGKTIFLGYFDNEIDAAITYNVQAKIRHGEFAVLNRV